MPVTLQTILRTSFAAYTRRVGLPGRVLRAAQEVMRCRTAELGGEVRCCPEGHVRQVRYNSCGHRACPQCWARKGREALERWKAVLLPTDHFHVVFTLPSELHELWRYNRRLLAELLFVCVRQTLFTLLADPKRLGARVGVLAALHTWSRTLMLHPHLHCLVSGGGLDPEGQWRVVHNGFLVPVAVMRKMFRGKLLSGIEELHRRGRLQLPADADSAALRRILKAAAAKKWNIRVAQRYAHGRGVAIYLARYVRGGPIKNHRLIRFDGAEVGFYYTNQRQSDDDGRPERQQLRLSSDEFIRRWSEHVPLPGQHVVRRWGVYAGGQGAQLERCRAQLAAMDDDGEDRDEPATSQQPAPMVVGQRCPVCGKELQLTEVWPRPGAPPLTAALAQAA